MWRRLMVINYCFDDLNFMLPPNGIVGVIGPNGAGKTTLFRLIMGLETVDKGEFEVGGDCESGLCRPAA